MNHDLGFLVPFLIAAFIGLAVFAVARSQQANRLTALRTVAAAWQGRAIDGGWFDHSHAELKIAGTTATLQYASKGKRTVTELTMHFPDPRLRLEVFPQTIVEQMKKFLGMQDIEVGSRQFDEQFIVQGNDPGLIREYLTRDTQAALQVVANCTWSFDMHLTIGGGTLRVTKGADIYQLQSLLQLVQACESLFIALVAARSLGIEILPSSTPPRVNDTHCQVCGEGLHGTIVYCTSCETPHHLDCWQYIGSCSVYACGQKRYRPAPR